MPTEYKFNPLAKQQQGSYTYLSVTVEEAPGIMEIGKFYELVFDPSGPKPQPYVFKVSSIDSSLQPGRVKYVGTGRFDKSVVQTVATISEVKQT